MYGKALCEAFDTGLLDEFSEFNNQQIYASKDQT